MQKLGENMKEFSELIEVSDALNHPQKGCPWDLIQNFQTLRPYLLEEAHEALEAIDSGSDQDIIEELGDLLYTIIFYAKVAERENRFSIQSILKNIKEKLIRRHPHVFGDKKDASMQEVIQNWEQIKKEEKKERKSALDGIPKTLPSLQRAFKIFQKIEKRGYSLKERSAVNRSEELALKIFEIVKNAKEEKIDIESAFRMILSEQEKDFLTWEQNQLQ